MTLGRSAGNRPPQHSDKRKAGRLSVQTAALPSVCPDLVKSWQNFGTVASSEAANGKSGRKRYGSHVFALTRQRPSSTLAMLPVEKQPTEHVQAPMALTDAARVRHILAWGS